MSTLQVAVVTGEKEIYRGEADIVIAPGAEGELGILPRHAALLTSLKTGEMRIKLGTEEDDLFISGGFLEVYNNVVTVLADVAEQSDEIDESRAQAARQRAQERLARAASGARICASRTSREALSEKEQSGAHCGRFHRPQCAPLCSFSESASLEISPSAGIVTSGVRIIPAEAAASAEEITSAETAAEIPTTALAEISTIVIRVAVAAEAATAALDTSTAIIVSTSIGLRRAAFALLPAHQPAREATSSSSQTASSPGIQAAAGRGSIGRSISLIRALVRTIVLALIELRVAHCAQDIAPGYLASAPAANKE